MVNDYNLLVDARPSYRRVYTAGSQVLASKAIGNVHISTNTAEVVLKDVLYVPGLNVKLLSTNSLTDEGARVILDSEGGKIHLQTGYTLRVTKNRAKGLLEFRGEAWRQSHAMAGSAELFEGVDLEFEDVKPAGKPSIQQIWHERLGHPGRDKTRKLIELLGKKSDIKLDPSTPLECSGCVQSKMTRARMGKGSGEVAAAPLDLLHIDLIIDGSRVSEYTCTLVVVDDYSKYVYVQPLIRKSDAFNELKRAVSLLETQTGRRVKAIRSDQGGEWASDAARTWSLQQGILWQKTTAYNSEQNGRVERMNRTLGERMRALLVQRRLPIRFWPHAIRAAAFKMNLTPNVDDRIPFEAMFKRSARRFAKLLKVFGCLSWVNVPKVKRDHKKLDVRANPAIFLGYSLERKGWLFYSPESSPSIFWSNSAKFLEHQCWDDRTEWKPLVLTPPRVPSQEEEVADLGYTAEATFDERDPDVIDDIIDMDKLFEEEEVEQELQDTHCKESTRRDSREASPASSAGATAGSDRPDQEEPVSTSDRFSIKDNERILQAKYEAMKASRDQWVELAEFYNSLNVLDGLPERPKDAMEDPGDPETWDPKLRRPATRVNLRNPGAALITAKPAKASQINLTPTLREAMAREDWPQWQEAMRKEYLGLEAMGTWEVADLPTGANTVDTKWVLKIKTDADMVPTKYKARLVARGFTQREGIDYEEVFAPVAPMDAVRGVLALAAIHDWEVDCIDVAQAYLNSTLHHEVYLKPPEGFSSHVPQGKALKLIKGLYGLKQSGREWNLELDRHLRKLGFHSLPSAPCIYTRGKGDERTVVTVYVDDMLIASSSRKAVDCTKRDIAAKWKIEDNGKVKEFLGIKVTRDRAERTLSLDQTAYIKKMVSKWISKDDKTWCPMLVHLDAAGSPLCDKERAKKYQELVGQLLWVANTVRPDIAFAVGTLARHMSEPKDAAWEAALKVLKYLNQTAEDRLVLGKDKDMNRAVTTYTDANWASDKATGRRSTSGSMTFVHGCLVSWKSHVQKCVALSAVESEFVAASEAVREALFFSYLLRDLGVLDTKPTLYTDSKGCIQVSKDPAKHWKLKHIDTRYHFVRDHVQEGDVAIEFIGTKMNVADILTKPLPKVPLSLAGQRVGLTRPLRGAVEDTTAECSGKQDGDGPESKSGDECKDGGLRGSAETFIPGSINGGTMLQRDGIVAMQPHEVGCGAKVTRRAEKILPSVLQQALTCISTGPSCRVH